MPDATAAAAWVDRRTAACVHHALLLQRADLAAGDERATAAVLAAAAIALTELRLDDEARELGLRADHLVAIRFALVALLDESAAHQPGGERGRDELFRRAGLPPSANVGHEFFERLAPRLADPAPGPADLAVLQVHAVCLLLGFRGRHGARVDADAAELGHLLRRLLLKLRPCLHPRPPPPLLPVPCDMPPRTPRWSLRIAALLTVLALALTAGLRAGLERRADELRAHLATLLP
jgi:type IV/VI secretion system ImpK/VasF family protein